MVLLQRQAMHGRSSGASAMNLTEEVDSSRLQAPHFPRPVSFMSLAGETRPTTRTKPRQGEADEVGMRMFAENERSTRKTIGGTAPLTEKGYKSVAVLHSQKEMEAYIRRVIADRDLHILDEGGLKGMLPYYSGLKATQSLKALSTEITTHSKKKVSAWLLTQDDWKRKQKEMMRKQKQQEKEQQQEELQRKAEEPPAEEASIQALGRVHEPPVEATTQQKVKAQRGMLMDEPLVEAARKQRVKGQRGLLAQVDPGTGLDHWMNSIMSVFDQSLSVMKAKDDHRELLPHSHEKADSRPRGSLVQTRPSKVQSRSHSGSSSTSSWVASLFGLFHGQALYWLGARVTLIACAGSLLFGLFLRDESSHQARAAALETEESFTYSTYPLPTSSLGKDRTLTDLRPQQTR